MDEFIKNIIGPVIGGALSTSAGLVMFWLKRSRDGRDVFRSVTAAERARLESHSIEWDVYHRESVPILQQAVYHVRPFVRCCRWQRLEQALREYQRIDRHRLMTSERALAGQLAGDKEPLEILRDSLTRFDECIG